MSVFEAAIGWLAPPYCFSCGREGLALCAACAEEKIIPFGEHCWRCGRLSPASRTCIACRHTGSPNFVWVATNYEHAARVLLSLYKFEHQRAAAKPLAKIMADNFLYMNSVNDLPDTDYLIVPIPTATVRVRERGFGHTEYLSRVIAAKLRLEYSEVLRRLGQTRQLGASRETRLKQLADSFIIKRPKKIAGRSILLIDDVVTTGGTIIAATKTLRSAGAKRVDALIFAKRL